MEKRIIIITAPSGSGKTTLVKRLLRELPELSFSVSAATRKPRKNEINGKDYYFLSVADFEEGIKQNRFLEWQMVYPGKYYGTLKTEMERIWNNQQTPIVDIDVQGAIRVKKQFQGDSLSIFIKAPSVQELERRLRGRQTDNEQAILERIDKAKEEMTFAQQFDRIIINDDLETAQKEIVKMVSDYIQTGQK